MLFSTSTVVLDPDGNATLTCIASGSPHPRLTLTTPEGVTPLQVEGPKLTSDETVELTMVVSDLGVYNCSAYNFAGTISRTITLGKEPH